MTVGSGIYFGIVCSWDSDPFYVHKESDPRPARNRQGGERYVLFAVEGCCAEGMKSW